MSAVVIYRDSCVTPSKLVQVKVIDILCSHNIYVVIFKLHECYRGQD